MGISPQFRLSMNKQGRSFISQDGAYAVQISKQVELDLVDKIAAAKSVETGGIIIGAYNSTRNCALVSLVTDPPPDSKAGMTWFYRGLKGLQELINKKWKNNLYYLGEWHFHPFATANPSATDIGQMIKNSRDVKYQCPEPILLIIGGSKEAYEIRVFVFFTSGNYFELKEYKPT